MGVLLMKNIFKNLLYFLLVLLLTACGENSEANLSTHTGGVYDPNDVTAPSVVSITPLSVVADVSVDASFKITFSEWVDYSSISTAISLKESNITELSFGIASYSNHDLVIKPNNLLTSYIPYNMLINTQLKDFNGNNLLVERSEEYVFFGNTAVNVDPNDITPPTILSTTPTDGGKDVDIYGTINIQFSEWVDYHSFLEAFSLKDVNNTAINYTIQSYVNKEIVVKPTAVLKHKQELFVDINSSLRDLNHNFLQTTQSLSFTIQDSQIQKTGQTISYINYDDGYYQIGYEQNITFDLTNEIAVDNVTGLTWETNVNTAQYWSDANAHCLSLDKNGSTEWRLPSIYELQKLMLYNTSSPSQDTQFDGVSGDYWSKTLYPYANSSYIYAWIVSLDTGDIHWENIAYHRCVLGNEEALATYQREPEGHVLDLKTKLMWQDSNSGTKNLSDAIGYCKNLSLDGYSDWRLPNINELFSLVRYEVANQTIDSTFKSIYAGEYWSSTDFHSISGYAWVIDFSNGNPTTELTYGSAYVRCVRGGI